VFGLMEGVVKVNVYMYVLIYDRSVRNSNLQFFSRLIRELSLSRNRYRQ